MKAIAAILMTAVTATALPGVPVQLCKCSRGWADCMPGAATGPGRIDKALPPERHPVPNFHQEEDDDD